MGTFKDKASNFEYLYEVGDVTPKILEFSIVDSNNIKILLTNIADLAFYFSCGDIISIIRGNLVGSVNIIDHNLENSTN